MKNLGEDGQRGGQIEELLTGLDSAEQVYFLTCKLWRVTASRDDQPIRIRSHEQVKGQRSSLEV